VPASTDYKSKIEDCYFRTSEPWRPWRSDFKLDRFGENYNAQTLHAWHVPYLLVDPDGKWLKQISSPGPTIVTGMRGCGKTMLLRALQFHARAVKTVRESDKKVVSRLEADGYVGFFVSASSLLSIEPNQQQDPRNLFARLVISYALEAARSLAHLQDIDASRVERKASQFITDSLDAILMGHEPCCGATIQELERELVSLFNAATRADSRVKMALPPSNAFPQLADAIRATTDVWCKSDVLFLLDDVSTRFLDRNLIDQLLSKLIFQNPDCAFKITSETQTIFLVLKSPGGIEQAAHWRDFETFDLGSEVSKRLKEKGRDVFLKKILTHRARLFPSHPQQSPSDILGSKTLASIANEIAESNPTSAQRKAVYSGFSALRAVCVGDMGSAITLYEDILRRSDGNFPIPERIQNEVFQSLCSRHLYLLDRRDGNLKAVAKSFATASYKLLMQSAKKGESRGLRQYTALYVRITAGDTKEQIKRLRELIDAGVFVFQGGAPRTKTRDSDPVLQFKLVFRKIYGLSNYIGLAERDRFELSGSDLEEWLNKPEKGADILLRNLETDDADQNDQNFSVEMDGNPTGDAIEKSNPPPAIQRDLFTINTTDGDREYTEKELVPLPKFTEFNPKSVDSSNYTLVLSLGFEERALESARRSLDATQAKRVLLIRHPLKGLSDKIINEVKKRSLDYRIIDASKLLSREEQIKEERVVVDVTGQTKSIIFRLIFDHLKVSKNVRIVYTEAEHYFPLEVDLKRILNAKTEHNFDALQNELKSVLTGEKPPYHIETLHSLSTDETRIKALLAFGSAKHERLIHLVEECNYDAIRVLVDNVETARATVARLAADVAVKSAQSGMLEKCDIQDPNILVTAIARFYQSTYFDGGTNIDIGLTGDKLEAIVVAAFCSMYPVNRILYVRPELFDPKRFTRGTAKTHFIEVNVEQ